MKHIKIAAGLAHVNYGRIADLVKEVSDAGLNLPMLIDLYLKLSNMDEADLDEEALLRETMETLQTSCVHTNTQLES